MRDGDDDQLMTSIKIDALWVVLDSLSAHTDMIVQDQYVHIITRDTELVLDNEDDRQVAHGCMRVIPRLGA